MTLTPGELFNMAHRHGGKTVDESGGRYVVYQCEAPAGKLWSASDTHVLRVEWRKRDRAGMEAALIDALDRMRDGVHDCNNPECDYCGGDNGES